MGKYQSRPVIVDAVQWTGDNIEEVAEFLGAAVEDIYVFPYNGTLRWNGRTSELRTPKGWYLMRHEPGSSPIPVPEKKFDRAYGKVPGAPYMDLTEFRNLGFLQEANRQFFHPLGLAMTFDCEDLGDGEYRVLGFVGFQDYRDDPEGFLFGHWEDQAQDRADHVGLLIHAKSQVRSGMFPTFDTVQPVGFIPSSDG